MSDLRIGISGWTYPPWRGVFYPEGLPQKTELNYAGRTFNSIEINGTFYSLQKPHSFQKWYDETPDDFVFAVKAGRYLTHILRLKEVDKPLANFFAQGILALGKKLGPILWQFPPNVKLKDDRFEKFLRLLPFTLAEAAARAKKHDAKVEGRSLTNVAIDGPLRHAFEFRHESFLNKDFLALLKAYNVAFVIADSAGHYPYSEELTADFVYVRLHGLDELYVSGYTPRALDDWAGKIRSWTKFTGRDAFIYFDNDAKARAPFDALGLMQRLGVRIPEGLGVKGPKESKDHA